MKIMICGSMSFAREMIDVKKNLEKLGHVANVPVDIKSNKYSWVHVVEIIKPVILNGQLEKIKYPQII